MRFIHQTGSAAHEALAQKFAESGVEGEVAPFIDDMPAAFARADLVVCRAGAGAVAELAAAGKPSILVPLPHAADQHQLRNAEAFEKAGAAVLVLDHEMDGGRLFEEVEKLRAQPRIVAAMGERARAFAHPGAARRAAEMCWKKRDRPLTFALESRNNTILKCFLSPNTCTSSESAASA